VVTTRPHAALPATLTLVLATAIGAQAGCGSETQSDRQGGAVTGGSNANTEGGRIGSTTGSAGTGGASTGTGDSGGMGGRLATGGAFTSTGGTSRGGASGSTGGMNSGGTSASTGGTNSGGTSSSGVDTGGAGGLGTGAVTGGMLDAGAPAGGRHAGGASTGGSVGSGGVPTGGGTPPGGAPSGGGHAGGTATGGTGPLSPVTLYIASDSTASTYADTASPNDQAGWGQMLPEVFSNNVTVVNKSAGGRTARWFYLEGALDAIVQGLRPGDYLFVQFGTNDGNETATFTVDGTTYPRYAAPDTDFKTYLKDYYLTPVRAKDGIVVFVTPPPRNSAYCGKGNSLASYAKAMRELGAAENVAVLDLNAKTFDYLSAICPSPTPEDFFFVRTDGTVDGTHFQENGARHLAGFIAECIRDVHLALEGYLRP
jgi:lysophospholipase L1-like esterase